MYAKLLKVEKRDNGKENSFYLDTFALLSFFEDGSRDSVEVQINRAKSLK